MELFAVFRNKFIHDILCNSFASILQQLDNGVINRFKKFLENENEITDELSCKHAITNLYRLNIDTIHQKIVNFRQEAERKQAFLVKILESATSYADLFSDLINELSELSESALLKYAESRPLNMEIIELVKMYNLKLQDGIHVEGLRSLVENPKIITQLFGIRKKSN